MTAIQFDTAFKALTDHQPLSWQRRLFGQLLAGVIPRVCDLPTGLGKTSVIPIWAIALASQAQTGSTILPRRLLYIVNRRTVVDQATSVVEKMRARLLAPKDSGWPAHKKVLRSLAGTLRTLASTEGLLLAVSTLRGELADNEEWKVDPARPAVIIGTIDMIGSKLLFSGYGDGKYWRAQHAGLVGQDSLIVHDEAHLTPAFSDLLHQLSDAQRQAREPKPLRVMELSATSRGGEGHILQLEPEDEHDKTVRERLDASKHLCLHEVQANSGERYADIINKTVEKLVALSLSHQHARAKVLIYIRSPEQAQKALDLLSKQLGKEAEERTALLTGTIRGHERDRLIGTSPYREFLDPTASVDRTVYLVSTSAGEVGIDIDADHMVCDLTTLDSMIQRLGRVNRRGGQGREAQVDVAVQTAGEDKMESQSEVTEAILATQKILTTWASKAGESVDVSPRAMRALLNGLDADQREKAFAPKPAIPPLTDILLDAWSLTTVTQPMPGRPEVAPYLHGLERDLPETYVAWRKEVALLDGAEVDQEGLSEWFQACRVQPRERLRDSTDRVKKALEALLKAHRRTDSHKDFPVVLLNERGEAELSRLSHIVIRDFNLKYRTVILPVNAGGLNSHGTLDAGVLEEAPDVAETANPEDEAQRRERWRLIRDVDGERYVRLMSQATGNSLPLGLRERERITLEEPPEGGEDGTSHYLILMAQQRQSAVDHAETAKTRQTLSFHLNRITGHMNRITEALGLDHEVKEALIIAARWHDRGKNRPVWQWYAHNPTGSEPLAKSTRYREGRALGGYRHEFGSVLEASADAEIQRHPEADLILHLIAAHHGWARPHFQSNAWDNTSTTADNEEAASEVMRRFGRLQQRFGRWGLAWLESLVRCADIAASQYDEVST